jgi:hypothetical protein
MSKSITYGLLAFAVSSSLSLAQDKVVAQDKPATGWSAKPGSGLTFDGGDAFGLKWSNRLQIHWTYANNEDNPDSNSFNIRRARTNLTGHVFHRNVNFALILDGTDSGAAGDGNIKQAWASYAFLRNDDAALALRVGQAKTMFGLEATWSSAGLWFVERSSASRAFADSYSRGAWLLGHMMKERPIRFSVGAMNTDVAAGLGAAYTDRGEETANSDNELSYVFAANWDLLGDFHDGKPTTESRRQGDWRTDDQSLRGTVGAGFALGNGKDTATGADIESTSINLNTAWTVAQWNLLGEFFMRGDDPQTPAATDEEEPTGFAVSAGYLFDRSGDSSIQWGLGVRYNFIETDDGTTGSGVDYLTGAQGGLGGTEGEVSEISAVVNAFYHGHMCKTQLEWTLQDTEPTGGSGLTNHIIRIGFQIEF